MSPPSTATKNRPAKASKADSIHKPRLTRLARAIRDAGASHLLVTNPADVAYLTGFLGGDSFLLVPASGKPTIISDFRFEEELGPVAAVAKIHIRSGPMLPAISALAKDTLGASGALAIQADHMTIAQRDALAKPLGAKRLVPTKAILSDLRSRKDEAEVRLIRAAVKLQEAALTEILPTIEPGQTESEVAARLEAAMKSRGASEPSFISIVAAGANGSLPHYRPAKARLRAGGSLLIDWGARLDGYCGDMTRTFALGTWPKKIRHIYEIVLEAHETAASILAPGVLNTDVDKAARDVITGAGLGDRFGHGLGHGLGIDVHEAPRLSHMAEPKPLEEGNVVTIEPGIYLPGIGGVRIEDDYVITPRGAKNLSSLPKSLQWATLS